MSESMPEVDAWIATATEALGLDQRMILEATPRLLDLARDVAHDVARPAAPLTLFVVGLALGLSGEDAGEPELTSIMQKLHERMG